MAVVWLALSGQSPSPQRVAAPRPSEENQVAGAANNHASPIANAAMQRPVRIVQETPAPYDTQPRETSGNQYQDEELETQKRAAEATEEQVIPAWLGMLLSGGATLLILWTLAETRKSTRLARATYEAFIAVEDASLVVEFHRGHIIESGSEGVRRPDTYYLPVTITNIGRSTARFNGWSVVGTDITSASFGTLKPGETWESDDLENLMLEEPATDFKVAFAYSSPVRERMILEVSATLKIGTNSAGVRCPNAIITKTQVRSDQEG